MVILPELMALAQLIITYVQEKRTTKRIKQEVNYENFLEWLIKNNHEEVLQFLKQHRAEQRKTQGIMLNIQKKFSVLSSNLKKLEGLLEKNFEIKIPKVTPVWERPYLRPGERWHYIDKSEGGEVYMFNALWKLRTPSQEIFRSMQFGVPKREAVDRMDIEGPFCKACEIELVQEIKKSGVNWICEGCNKKIVSKFLIEEARGKVYRINKPKILKLFLTKYPECI